MMQNEGFKVLISVADCLPFFNTLSLFNVVLGTCINKTFAKGLVCIVFHQLQISLVKTLCLKCNDLLNMSVGRWRESVTITVKKKKKHTQRTIY